MGFMTNMKARQAATKQSKGDVEGAMQLYKEAVAEGLNDPRMLLSYSVLLLRKGQYQDARDLLVKTQKVPGLTDDQRVTLFVNYAACVYKQGDLQKGIEVLERQHLKNPSGLVYETLGYLYVEAGDKEKAISFNEEALDYDDEDSISLDNLAQAYFRLANDKEKAKEYFDKAIKVKPGQIDTLYFLAMYDLEAGDKDAAREKLETALEGKISPLNYATKERIEDLLSQC